MDCIGEAVLACSDAIQDGRQVSIRSWTYHTSSETATDSSNVSWTCTELTPDAHAKKGPASSARRPSVQSGSSRRRVCPWLVQPLSGKFRMR